MPDGDNKGDLVHRCYGHLRDGKCSDCLVEERDRLRETLERIADHSQEFTQEIHGYKGYGQALGAVHDMARRAVDPLASKES
jgi:hypothetical protein